MHCTVEICCGSYEDALVAYKGNADRIELTAALYIGGVTPSTACVTLVKRDTDFLVCVMIRPRGAGFCYSHAEFECMYEETRDLLNHGADGIVFGFLNPDFSINAEYTAKLVELVHANHKEAIMHRAFDCTSADSLALKQLIDLGIDRVLTSGGKKTALEGKDMLNELVHHADNSIEILAGGGIHADNAAKIITATGVTQIHSSCRDWKTDPTTVGKTVAYNYADGAHTGMYDAVSLEKVQALKQAVARI